MTTRGALQCPHELCASLEIAARMHNCVLPAPTHLCARPASTDPSTRQHTYTRMRACARVCVYVYLGRAIEHVVEARRLHLVQVCAASRRRFGRELGRRQVPPRRVLDCFDGGVCGATSCITAAACGSLHRSARASQVRVGGTRVGWGVLELCIVLCGACISLRSRRISRISTCVQGVHGSETKAAAAMEVHTLYASFLSPDATRFRCKAVSFSSSARSAA